MTSERVRERRVHLGSRLHDCLDNPPVDLRDVTRLLDEAVFGDLVALSLRVQPTTLRAELSMLLSARLTDMPTFERKFASIASDRVQARIRKAVDAVLLVSHASQWHLAMTFSSWQDEWERLARLANHLGLPAEERPPSGATLELAMSVSVLLDRIQQAVRVSGEVQPDDGTKYIIFRDDER